MATLRLIFFSKGPRTSHWHWPRCKSTKIDFVGDQGANANFFILF